MEVEGFIFVGKSRVVGVFDEASGVFAVEFGIHVLLHPCLVQVFNFPIFTGEIDHGTRTEVLGLHVESGYTGSIAHFLIIGTEGGCDVNDTCTILGGYIVARDDAIGSRSRVHPREERIVFQSDKVSTFVTSDNLGVLEICAQTRFGQDDVFAGFQLNLHIVDFRTDAECGVAGERPWRSGPCDYIAAVLEVELGGAGQVFDVAIASGLVQLVRGKSRSGGRRVGLNGIALVEVAFFVKFLQEVPQRFDILVVVGDVGIVEVHPISHLLGQVGPFARIFHHLAAAGSVVFVHGDFLADILLGDTEHFLYAQFDGQSVGIPSGLATHLVALHGLEPAEGILDGASQHVVNTGHAVGRRRSLEEEEGLMPLAGLHALPEEVFFLPLVKYLAA